MRHAVVIKEKAPVQESKFIGFDVNQIRDDFPILHTNVHSKPLIYLDNAATTQKPQLVIDNVTNYYLTYNSNIHRGVHYLSEFATRQYELSRRTIRKFINARYEAEIIFTRGTTESINLVASTFGRMNFSEGDEILITGMEHHSNIVPWQMLCEEKKCVLRIVPLSDSGEIDLNDVERLIGRKTKLVSIVHVSNSLGTVNPVWDIIKIAHDRNIPVLLDAAQSVQHFKLDVQSLDCDFLAFSGHKIYGPTGIGVLYGKKEILETMPPYQGGGDMIMSVSFERTIYNDLPYKFEAGTPNIEAAIGLGEAIRYVDSIGLENIYHHEKNLLDYATEQLSSIDGLRIIGTAGNKSSVISFVLDGIHPHDVGTLLDADGIAIRTGHHCTEPVMRRYNVPATSRASFALYNTIEEVDALAESINKVIKMFR